MHQNPIYICTSWCSKICWFLVKKCWCQQNSKDVSRDLYNFWIFFRSGITVKFHHCRICLTVIREGGQKSPPDPWAFTKKPILNRVNTVHLFFKTLVTLLYMQSIISFISSTQGSHRSWKVLEFEKCSGKIC